MREAKFSEVLKQYKIYHFVEDDTEYRQVTISIHSGVSYRGTKFGRDIGRKRQFVIDLEEYPNTFIFTRQGVQNGSYGMAPKEVHGCVVTENMPMFSIEPTLNPEYLEYYLQTNHFQDQLQALNASGSAQKSIHEKVLLQLNILLPDIEEQKSIVDEIKSVENKQSKVLDELQTQSKLINKLRSSILSDAVSGKLVPQDPNDGNAEVLLEKIKAEKEKLIKEGKIKKQKPLPPISKDEIPYELPDGWGWCRLNAICKLITDGAHHTPTYIESGIPFLSVKDVSSGKIDFSNTRYISSKEHEELKKRCNPEINDILLTKVGTTGIAVKVDTEKEFSIFVSIALLKTFSMIINSDYLEIMINSPIVKQQSDDNTQGIGNKNLVLRLINNFIIPLPPLEEQKQIVEKVEKLMATCDALEFEVQNSKIETEKLMQSVLKEAFSDSDTPRKEIKTPKASKAFQRSVLAAYIVDNSLEDRYFGHVKLQKMLFMCEAVNSLDFDSNYKRHAMGPYDPKLIRSVDTQLKRNKWFECKKMDGDKGRYIYSPLEKSDEYKKYLDRYFKLENIETMFSLMRPMSTLQAEIVATLYSVYKDLKSTQQKISSQMLIDEARNNWHDRKKTIEVKKWERAIEWMREKQLIS